MIEFERDEVGRVTAAGRHVQRVTPSGIETPWAYDVSGRPTTLEAAGHELRFGYDQVGRETAREVTGGAELAQKWGAVGRLAAQVLTGRTGAGGSQPGHTLGGVHAAAVPEAMSASAG
jgi:YD repeat-containing protein